MTLTMLIGWDPDTFPWPCSDHLEPWELYLFALIYLQYSVIRNGAIPFVDMYNAKNEKLRFPQVNHGHVDMLEPVVQLLRHPSVIFSSSVSGISSLPRYNVNVKLYFSTSALAYHLRAIDSRGRCRAKFSVGNHGAPRALASRLAHGSWWASIKWLIKYFDNKDSLRAVRCPCECLTQYI
jgi:hypothetical protein